jgi:hypothetical protein
VHLRLVSQHNVGHNIAARCQIGRGVKRVGK